MEKNMETTISGYDGQKMDNNEMDDGIMEWAYGSVHQQENP